MIGIFQDSFLDYIKDNLGGTIKTTSKNIVCRCPWCEYEKDVTGHYHLWISIEAPIFHCFHCQKSGFIKKLFVKIEGKDTSEQFVDKSKVKDIIKNRINFSKVVPKQKPIILPLLKKESFPYKTMYVKKRLKFSNVRLSHIKGMVFDIFEFVQLNNITLDFKQSNMMQYLQTNFVGFVTANQSKIVFRNIDETSEFRFYKIALQESQFLDYYKLPGGNRNSNDIVVAEGIFDIFSEHIFNYTNLGNKCRLYAAALSTSYGSLVKSIAFHEQLFRINLHVLSDRNVEIWKYKNLKKYMGHVINTIIIYYNKTGKDFNDAPVELSTNVI